MVGDLREEGLEEGLEGGLEGGLVGFPSRRDEIGDDSRLESVTGC